MAEWKVTVRVESIADVKVTADTKKAAMELAEEQVSANCAVMLYEVEGHIEVEYVEVERIEEMAEQVGRE